jgi:tetratricopeptide (TPR) repeat protein
MTVDDLVEKATEQRRRGRLDEALISARKATTLDPGNADAFWQLALCQLDTGVAANAVGSLKRVTELAPLFARGWTRLGLALQDEGESEQAQECLEQAVKLKPDEVKALLKLAPMYQLNGQPEDELRVRAALDELVDLDVYDLNRLGILHQEKKDFYAAIRYYWRVAAQDPAGLFNLGLVFKTPEVSQDADAIDVWRRALERNPNYDRARVSIANLLPLLGKLRSKVLAIGETPLDPDQWYGHYINPFELLALEDDAYLDDSDAKTIQRAKKALLQEIDLEEGRVAWMPALLIDRSRAMAICEDLNDERLLSYHHHVFVNRDLSAFLSRGVLGHFLVDDWSSPLETIKLLEENPDGFGCWLSSRFAPQYDLVLTRAIGERCLPAVECLLDGRRWVRPEDEDRCFEGAQRQVDRMLVPLRKAAERSEKIKPTLVSIQAILAEGGLSEILKLLPVVFYKSQEEAAALVREISIACHNHHDDADSAKAILLLSQSFVLKSPSLQHRIEEDLKTLEERINAARKAEAHFILGRGMNCDLTREGIRFGEKFISAEEVRTVRWGTLITRTADIQKDTFQMVIRGLYGAEINIAAATTRNHDAQRQLFAKLIDAALTYLMPKVIKTTWKDLKEGKRVRVGNVTITHQGVEFLVKALFTSKTVVCPWSRLKSAIADGEVVLSDPANPKANLKLSLYETDNALALYLIAQGMD